MQRILFLFAFICLTHFAFAVRITGTVTDENNNPLPFAVVFVKGTTIGTSSNADGIYFLDVNEGVHQIAFKIIGYQQLEKQVIVVNQNLELNAQLFPSTILLKEIKITAGAEDPAYAVIRAAQKKRHYYLTQVNEYSCNVFIKGVARITKYPPKKIAGIKVSIGGLIDSASGIVYLSESESKYYFKQPDKVHEEMIASKTSGTKTGFSYNRASELDFNFYKTTLKNSALSERGFISPIAPNALRFYSYKLLGTFYENEEMINKIQVIPKRKSDAVFSGIIYITENSWRIYSTDLVLDKNTGIEWVDSLHIRQEYLKVNDSTWMPFKNNFEYIYSALGARGLGTYTGINSNYAIHSNLSKTVFTNEAISFHKDALNKDSSYWSAKRSIPLTQVELKDYHQRDSINVLHSSVKYIDSTERAQNKFKWNHIIEGYTFKSELRKCEFTFEPMYDNIAFNTVQGLVLTPTWKYIKKFAPTKNYELGGTLGYGFSNRKYFGYGHLGYTYNTKTFSKVMLSGGKDMLQFNTNAISPLVNTLYTLLLKDNFMKLFEKYYTRVEHSTELVNGLVLFTAAEIDDRIPLLNSTDFALFKSNKEFQSNDPLIPNNPGFSFSRNQAFYLEGAIQYTPFQPYYFTATEKMIEESNYPTFTLYYKRAIKGILKSDVELELIKAGIEGNLHWKRAGTLHYLLEAGHFANREEMSFMDWKYFNGNKTLYSNFSGKQFQLLDYYASSSNNKYMEIHLEQNFNGLLTSKIPLLKKAKIQELITANYLLTSDKKKFIELGIGLRKLFVRVDYVFGFDNYIYTTSGIRFGFLF